MWGILVSSQKLQIFGFEKLFSFPCGFSLGVVAPLYLIESASLSPSNPSLVIHNFHRMFWIHQIGLQLQFLYVNHLFWNTDTFPELRDMKYIMNHG